MKKNSELTYKEMYQQPASFQAVNDTLEDIFKTLDKVFFGEKKYDELIFTGCGTASQDRRNQIHFSARNKDFRSQTANLYFHYTVESDNSLSIPAIPGAEPPFPGQQFSTFF